MTGVAQITRNGLETFPLSQCFCLVFCLGSICNLNCHAAVQGLGFPLRATENGVESSAKSSTRTAPPDRLDEPAARCGPPHCRKKSRRRLRTAFGRNARSPYFSGVKSIGADRATLSRNAHRAASTSQGSPLVRTGSADVSRAQRSRIICSASANARNARI